MYYKSSSSVENTCTIKFVLADCCCRIIKVLQKRRAVIATVVAYKSSGDLVTV